MNKPLERPLTSSQFDAAARRWQEAYAASPGTAKTVVNRSGITVQPLYSPAAPDASQLARQGSPGEYPFPRGSYPSMQRGRSFLSSGRAIGVSSHAPYSCICSRASALATSFDSSGIWSP